MSCWFIFACLVATPNLDESVRIQIHLQPETLQVGLQHKLAIRLETIGDASFTHSGMPRPIIQVKAPPSVRLIGDMPKTLEELKNTQFLQSPYEQFGIEGTIRYEFELLREPTANEHFLITVVGCVRPDKSVKENWFWRRSFMLPLVSGASPMQISTFTSDTPIGTYLHIESAAVPFQLDSIHKDKISLLEPDGRILIVTYAGTWCHKCRSQLTELQNIYDEFEKRNTEVIAISQYDSDWLSFSKILRDDHLRLLPEFSKGPRFKLAVDLDKSTLAHYRPTTAYFVDQDRIIRQVFPMSLYGRAAWDAIYKEIDRLDHQRAESQPAEVDAVRSESATVESQPNS